MVDPKHAHAWITVDHVRHSAIVIEWTPTTDANRDQHPTPSSLSRYPKRSDPAPKSFLLVSRQPQIHTLGSPADNALDDEDLEPPSS